jgi:hypothetical protein
MVSGRNQVDVLPVLANCYGMGSDKVFKSKKIFNLSLPCCRSELWQEGYSCWLRSLNTGRVYPHQMSIKYSCSHTLPWSFSSMGQSTQISIPEKPVGSSL